jgi:hypothetical protein
MATIDNVEKAEIFPINPPSNGRYSFKNGFPIIQFQIANQDKFLNATTLRLNGTLRLQGPGASSGNLVPPTNTSGGAAATNGIALNQRVGIPSVLQQITLATQSNQTLEVVRSYGRYLASVMAVTHSASDFDTANTIGNPASASRSFNSALQVNNDVSFSIPLRTGLLQSGSPLPLGNNGLRGMLINLELAPDAHVISGYSTFDATGAETKQLFNPISTGAFYELADLSLTYDLLVPDESGRQKMSAPATGQFLYNSISQLYGVLNSSDQTQNYNLGTANTLSVFHNFIPTTQINNYAADGFSTGRLKNSNGGAFDVDANLNRVTFIRGGSKFPLDFALDVEKEAQEDRPQTELEQRFIDSIKPLPSFNHSLVSLNTQNKIGDDIGFQLEPTPRNDNTLAEPAPVFGAGVNLDPLTRVGVDFKNTNYGIRLESNLDGNSPNSIYTYVVAKNVLTYSPNGIMVSS